VTVASVLDKEVIPVTFVKFAVVPDAVPIPDILSNVDGLLMLIDFAISNNNYNIIKYALENIRVNEDDTQFVKMNAIITAIKNDDVDILKNLLKIIKFEDVVIYDFLADKAKQNNKLEYEKIIKESI
jgi:hypothetical protein